MELRKVQCTNSGTFFLTLPKGWANRFGLRKGAILALSESLDGRLFLDPKYDATRKTSTATIETGPYLSRKIVGRYLLGYDKIRIEAKNRISPEERTSVKETSSSLVGLEIVEEDHACIVLQCLLEPAAYPPEKILRREYNITAGMYRDAVNAFLESDFNLAKNVIARDVEVNRFYFLLVRTLRTAIQNQNCCIRLGIQPIDCLDYRLCASLVEAIGDRAVEVAEKTLTLKSVQLTKDIVDLMKNFSSIIYEAQESAMKAFFIRDVLSAEKVRDARMHMESFLLNIEDKVEAETTEAIPIILKVTSAMCQILCHSVDIADLVMSKEL